MRFDRQELVVFGGPHLRRPHGYAEMYLDTGHSTDSIGFSTLSRKETVWVYSSYFFSCFQRGTDARGEMHLSIGGDFPPFFLLFCVCLLFSNALEKHRGNANEREKERDKTHLQVGTFANFTVTLIEVCSDTTPNLNKNRLFIYLFPINILSR